MQSVGMTVIGLLLLASNSSPAVAQEDSIVRLHQAPSSTIYINTQAATRVPADRATIYLIVDASAGTPSQASERASSAAQAVLDTLRRLGLGPQAARLTNYGAAPAMGTGTAGPMPGATFAARSVIRVELRRLELLATVATAAFGRGATLIGPIQFSAATSDSARRAALAGSLAQARQDAEELARASGGRLGRLLNVNMNSAYSAEYNPQQLPLGGPQYQYDAAAAWRTPPEVMRSWNVSTSWEILLGGTGK
jgi:uncharacterized protein YggE